MRLDKRRDRHLRVCSRDSRKAALRRPDRRWVEPASLRPASLNFKRRVHVRDFECLLSEREVEVCGVSIRREGEAEFVSSRLIVHRTIAASASNMCRMVN